MYFYVFILLISVFSFQLEELPLAFLVKAYLMVINFLSAFFFSTREVFIPSYLNAKFAVIGYSWSAIFLSILWLCHFISSWPLGFLTDSLIRVPVSLCQSYASTILYWLLWLCSKLLQLGCMSSPTLTFFMIVLDILCPLYFHINFGMSLSICILFIYFLSICILKKGSCNFDNVFNLIIDLGNFANGIIFSNVDGPRDCYTEWNKSEKDK